MHRLLALATAILVACGGGGGSTDTPPPAPPEVTGVILEITRDEGRVASFVLLAGDSEYEIQLDPERDYGFDLEHLEEHRTTKDPVRVQTERRGEAAVALSVDDA